ncbi:MULTISPECIES: hypothetical protein [Sporomusa]|jgi:hypothetical protein|uniref:Uncharacterized protein n=1 Tax=Sporomusa sphaeroides DSM 2875 TaxID=1337886 RepID=A0ABP2C315_9FIRM|nr:MULTISPECIES: hypothetical protein [Sporomusa]MCM0759899.1 hypothetical protein [Sporomusa sphaeroides DSM 2875]OLS56279.1 hypothetical protein SPSPH_26710 [Sporomusa sphaeroides DSM 2875]CVK18375.1 hypothetical protein SSPH_01012 [Sporomusa sphaeroides DSM 2875]
MEMKGYSVCCNHCGKESKPFSAVPSYDAVFCSECLGNSKINLVDNEYKKTAIEVLTEYLETRKRINSEVGLEYHHGIKVKTNNPQKPYFYAVLFQ